MRLHLRFGHSATLLALLGLTAAGASAQTVLKGTFELPEQAYWDSTMLPAGEYSLSVSKEPTGVGLISVRGEGVEATFLAPAGSREETSGANCLKIENVNGAYLIRELDSSVLNRSYKFGVSKAVRKMALSGKAAPAVTVPVSPAASF